MIKIRDVFFDPGTAAGQYPADSLEGKTLAVLNSSRETYVYDSLEELKFELALRKALVHAARELDRSRLSFRTFRKSKCNTDYWHRTEEGGFLLNSGVKPSSAIRDIYTESYEYGTECATAIVIVLYKALLDVYSETLFNQLFSGIYLMDWQHLDNDLGVAEYGNVKDSLPGDCRYFKNPDVSPLTPEWQGENTYDLGDGTYYGHGLGIGSAEEIIFALNRHREPGSDTSAYLLDTATRPDFKHLARMQSVVTTTP